MAQGEEIPMEVIHALTDPQCLKHAYNAAFEWYCLSKYMGAQLPPAQWRDTMLHGLYAGYTAGLDATGRALGHSGGQTKADYRQGSDPLFLCALQAHEGERRQDPKLPASRPRKMGAIQDLQRPRRCGGNGDRTPPVRVSRAGFRSEAVGTDLLINARGVAVDMDFCEGALELGETIRAQLTDEAVQLSGLQNPNSVKQLARWLSAETGDDITTLRKETIKELLGRDNADHVQRMLEIRQELGKTSTTEEKSNRGHPVRRCHGRFVQRDTGNSGFCAGCQLCKSGYGDVQRAG